MRNVLRSNSYIDRFCKFMTGKGREQFGVEGFEVPAGENTGLRDDAGGNPRRSEDSETDPLPSEARNAKNFLI
jgi:hypothetical protein